MRAADQQQQASAAGQIDLIGIEAPAGPPPDAPKVRAWTEEEILVAEKEALGLYLTGHPYQRYETEFRGVAETGIAGLDLARPRAGIVAGTVLEIRRRNTRAGKMAAVTLDNDRDRVEVVLFGEKFEQYRDKLQKDCVLVVLGELGIDERSGGCRVRAERLYEVDEVRAAGLRAMEIEVHAGQAGNGLLREMHAVLESHQGGPVPVSVRYVAADGTGGRLRFGKSWRIRPEQALFDALEGLLGRQRIHCRYDTAKLLDGVAVRPARPYG